jgi:hypothetical protein
MAYAQLSSPINPLIWSRYNACFGLLGTSIPNLNFFGLKVLAFNAVTYGLLPHYYQKAFKITPYVGDPSVRGMSVPVEGTDIRERKHVSNWVLRSAMWLGTLVPRTDDDPCASRDL